MKTQGKQEPAASSSSAPSLPRPSSSPPPEEPEFTVYKLTDHSSLAEWPVPYNPELEPEKTIYSRHFEVGGFDFCIVLYPKGNYMASPGFLSLYIQINAPHCSSIFNCFAGYKLSIVNQEDESKSLARESYHRFSSKENTNGWFNFGFVDPVFDPTSGFLKNGSLLVSVVISILDESVSFTPYDNNNNEVEYSLSSLDCNSVVLNGKFNWKVKNFSLFEEMIKTKKITSSGFLVGKVLADLNVYETKVNGVEYLFLFMEAHEAHICSKCSGLDKSSWCLFRISVLNQRPGHAHMHKDSYGRFSVVNSDGDDSILDSTNYIKMSDFIGSDKGFVVDDTVVFAVSFNAIKDSAVAVNTSSRADLVHFTWKIENFTRLKDILKKKKMKGVFVKSNKFQNGNHEFRLVVYPRGQSQKPFYLSMYLEALSPRNATTDWSCFASYALVVVNQKMKNYSILSESHDRFSKATKEWGWSEVMTLASLFDKDSGYVVQDTVTFEAQVLILKETFKMQDIPESGNKPARKDGEKKRWSITWQLENFVTFGRVVSIENIYSKYFQVDQLELRIGVDVSSDTICAYLECDPSVQNDPEQDFWVSYRMTVVNQKHPAKSFWKESSLCTKICANYDLQFMKRSDLLKADAGFVMGEMVTLVCEILDYCPWFDFSDLEALNDVTSTELHETTHMDNSGQHLATERDHLNDEDNASLILILKEELKKDLFALAGILIGMQLYLDDPIKLKDFFHQLSGCIDSGQIDVILNKFTYKLDALTVDEFRHQKIENALLDVMVECCQRLNRKSGEDPRDASAKPFLGTNEVSSQTKFHWLSSLANFLRSLMYERFFGIDNCMDDCSNTSGEAILGQHDSTSESSEEILAFIVISLKALNVDVTRDPSEPSQGCQFMEKILVLINEAPKHLLPDLISLLPKLACQFEHKVVACAILDQLQVPGAESSMRLLVLEAMCQLQFGIDVWERAFFQASEVVGDLNGEELGAAICLLFKAASQCQHIPQAISVVRQRLERLGAEVSPYVLDILGKTLNSSGDLAVTMLRKIDSDFSLDKEHLADGIRPSSSGEIGLATESLYAGDHRFSDIFMLLWMLAMPSIATETTQTFEKGIANGFITYHSVKMLFKKCTSVLGVHVDSSEEHQSGNNETAEKGCVGSLYTEEVFTLVFGLADKLFLSRHSRVHEFLRKFYSILLRLFADENYQKKMLRRLVEHVVSPAKDCSETSLDVLVFLVNNECKVSRLVLNMIRDDFQLANSDLSALRSRLNAKEDEYSHAKEELQNELSKMRTENLTSLERLREFEATILHYKTELRLERDRSAQGKKELSEQLEAIEHQFHHTFSEQNDQLVELSNEKKFYQDRLCNLEMQMQQELKEKIFLAEKLRATEADKERFVEELRRRGLQLEAIEAAQRSLLDEVQKLKQNLEQIKREKQEKEEEIAQCKTYNYELQLELNTHQEKNVLAEKLRATEAEKERFVEELRRRGLQLEAQEAAQRSVLAEVQKLKQNLEQIKREKQEKEEEIAQCKSYSYELQLELNCRRENNVLTEKLRATEAEKERFVEELRRRGLQLEAREAAQRSLLDEVQKLKQNLEQIKREKQEKEEEIAQRKTYNFELQLELNSHQAQINSLRVSLQEEILRHGPIYGVGLENLSMNSLENLARFHEGEIRNIRATQLHLRRNRNSLPP